MMVHSLSSGKPYSKLDKILVIFVTEQALEGEEEPIYLYESTRNESQVR